MPKDLIADEVRRLLDYDPKTGSLTWRKTGKIAGTVSPHGYRIIQIRRVLYRAHWLSWLIAYGVWPTDIVDHKNLDGCDNRLNNLREATRGQNRANSRRNKRKYDLPKGVFARGKKFGAQIVSGGLHHYLGLFSTSDEAHAAYLAAADVLHGEFARAA